MMDRPIKTVDITTPITRDNLPAGMMWDEDGACFKAEECDPANPINGGRDWRWVPMNFAAIGKGEPDKPMTPYYPPKPG